MIAIISVKDGRSGLDCIKNGHGHIDRVKGLEPRPSEIIETATMKKHTLLKLALALSLSGFTTAPALASQPVEVGQPTSSQGTVIPQEVGQSTSSQGTVIPQSAAIIVTFPAEMTLDAGKKQDYPITLALAQPLLDSNGNVVVPQNSPVSVLLRTTTSGVQIIAESVVARGMVIPIQASSPVIRKLG